MWPVKGEKKLLRSKDGHAKKVTNLTKFDGNFVVSGDFDGNILLWKEDGTNIGEISNQHSDSVHAFETVTVDHDYDMMYTTIWSGGFDGKINVWKPNK